LLVSVAPVPITAFGAFVGLEIVRAQGWVRFAAGVIAWSGFAIGLSSGMVVRTRRRFLDAGEVTPTLLLAVAVGWGLILVAAQYALLVAVAAATDARSPDPQLLVPVVLVLVLGLGVGIVVARLASVREVFAGLAPFLIVVSLAALPVLWGASAVGGAGRSWIRNGPFAGLVTSSRAGAGGSGLDAGRMSVTAGFALLLVASAGSGLRRRRAPATPDGVALSMSGVRTRVGMPGSLDLRVMRGERVTLVDRGDDGRSRVLDVAAGPPSLRTGSLRRGPVAVDLLRPGRGFHPGVPAFEAARLRGLAIGCPAADARVLAERVVAFADLGTRVQVPVGRLSRPELARLSAAFAIEGPADLVLWNDDLLHSQPTFRQRCLAVLVDEEAATRTTRGWLVGTSDLGKVGEYSDRVAWIDAGEVRASGSAEEVLALLAAPRVRAFPDPDATGSCRILDVSFLDPDGERTTVVRPGDPIHVVIDLDVPDPETAPVLLCSLAAGGAPFVVANMFLDGCRPNRIVGTTRVECRFEHLLLAPGKEYMVRFAIYAADRMTVVYPKREIASFVTGGTAADLGFGAPEAERRIREGTPVFTPYAWKHADSDGWVGPSGPLRPV